MMSRTGAHAVTALIVLAELGPKQYAGAADVAARISAPRNYLGKLLKRLAETGLLESQKGKGGGFRLARDPSSISLFEIIDPIEHLDRWEGCFLGRPECSAQNRCSVHEKWQHVRQQYLAFLRETTLAELTQRQTAQLVR